MYAEVDSGWLIHSYCNTDPVTTTGCRSLTPTYTAVLCDLAALLHDYKSYLMTYANDYIVLMYDQCDGHLRIAIDLLSQIQNTFNIHLTGFTVFSVGA